MKTLLSAAILSALMTTAHAQQPGPPAPEVRALQQTNGELMQAWTGARAALIKTQDELAAAQIKIQEMQTAIPRQGNMPMHSAPVAANPPPAPAPEPAPEKAP